MNRDARSDNAFEHDMPGTNARTQAEAAIEELRKRGGIFVEAVRATRMPMALTDPNLPGNPIVFANQALLGLSGYRMEEILGQQPYFMNGSGTDPKDAARFAEAIRGDQDDIIETVQYRKDGSRFVATVLISAFKDEQGRVLNHFMSWLDVTRRVDAEGEVADLMAAQAALRASESKYRTLFNSLDEGFCVIEVIFDAENQPVDYVFLETNASFERQTGLAEAVGKRMLELAPEHEQHWFDIYGQIALTGEPQRFEQAAAALGRWYDAYAFRLGDATQRHVAILFNDITDRRRAEEALREGKERQDVLLGLSDALRPLAEAAEIQALTAQLVGQYLGVDRAMYGEVTGERGAESGIIRGQYVRPGTVGDCPIEPFPDHFTFAPFGERTMERRYSGQGLVVCDIDSAAGYEPAEREAWRAAKVRSAIVVPLVKEGLLVAEFGVHCVEPRNWTAAEVALLRDVAERTWAAAERARAEAALRESEAKYRSLFESMDEAYAVVEVLKDDRGEWADFRFLEVNPAFMEHTGMPYPVGKTATELLATPNPRWAKFYGDVLESGKPLRIEEAESTLGLTFDLNIFSLDRDRNRVAVLFTNITERKNAEAALRESEEQLRLIVDSALDYAIFTMDLDNRITSWLPGAQHVFGWTPEEIVGQPADITFTPEDRAKNEPQKETEEAKRNGTAPNVRWHVRKDGSRVFIDGHVVALRNEQGEVDGFLKIGQDTTERHRAREHERILVAELQHRVRNTLAVIRSIVRRTANTADSVEQFEQNLDGRLSSFARTQAYVTRDFEGSMDLEMIVRDELLAHAAGDSEQVSIEGPSVRLTPKQAETISLAMHELASNAMKHGALAGEGNRVDVKWSLEGGGEERRLHLSWLETLNDRTLETPQRSGFGTELLEKVMRYELDAEPEIEFRPNGLSYRVAIPLSIGAPSR